MYPFKDLDDLDSPRTVCLKLHHGSYRETNCLQCKEERVEKLSAFQMSKIVDPSTKAVVTTHKLPNRLTDYISLMNHTEPVVMVTEVEGKKELMSLALEVQIRLRVYDSYNDAQVQRSLQKFPYVDVVLRKLGKWQLLFPTHFRVSPIDEKLVQVSISPFKARPTQQSDDRQPIEVVYCAVVDLMKNLGIHCPQQTPQEIEEEGIRNYLRVRDRNANFVPDPNDIHEGNFARKTSGRLFELYTQLYAPLHERHQNSLDPWEMADLWEFQMYGKFPKRNG